MPFHFWFWKYAVLLMISSFAVLTLFNWCKYSCKMGSSRLSVYKALIHIMRLTDLPVNHLNGVSFLKIYDTCNRYDFTSYREIYIYIQWLSADRSYKLFTHNCESRSASRRNSRCTSFPYISAR